MWSKPAESGAKTQKSTRTENKNSSEETTKNRQKAFKNKSRNRNNNKNASASDDLKSKKDEINAKTATKDNIEDEVVLRKKSEALRNPSNRYSDGFTNENLIEDNLVTSTPLTRTLSGFFNVEEAKRSRRFSDLFRPGADKYPEFKTNLNSKSLDCDDATTSKKDNDKNKNSKKEENVPASQKAEPSKRGSTKSVPTPKEPQDSYLKRVRSRIYKSKSDDTAKIELDNKRKAKKTIDLNGRIPEESIVTTVNARRPLSNLLTRQTTNLEYISRPFGSRKSLGITESTVDKPVLTKAKSSSAINLNLLRTRRAKIMEQAASLQSAASKVCNEFDYIAFGGLQSDRLHGSTTSLRKFPSWLHISREEPEDSHPVTLSVSNREFDSDDSRQMDEVDASMDNQEEKVESPKSPKPTEMKEEPTTIPEISISHENENKKTTTNISRSESLKEQQSEKKKQRRNVSDPLQNNSTSLTVYTKDSDSDIEEKDDHFWEELISAEELNKLPPSERRRQDVINEFFHTETSHVQMLKVLYKLFYKRLQESHILKPDELALIFPNIRELLDIHLEMEKQMKHIKKENPLVSNIGDMLLNVFGGDKGERLKTASATFCERQQLALDLIKKRRERDSKFNTLLAETEKERKCRRLQLQSIVPCEMQRLVKYPLLLERLIKSVDGTSEEHADEVAKLRLAHSHSKNVLNHVNEAAKAAHNKHRLEEIQKHLDATSFKASDHKIVKEFRNIDLTSYNLVLEGHMQLRRPNKAPTNVHVLLLEELVLILQKDNDKFILKFFSAGSPTSQLPLSPIIKLNNLLVRKNAVVKEALFLVNMSANNSQMYDLMAEDESKRDIWLKQFSEATDIYNKKRRTLDLDDTEMEEFLDLPTPTDREKSIDTISVSSIDSDKKDTISNVSSTSTEATMSASNNDIAAMYGSGNRSAVKVDVEDWPLIQPSQVTTIVPPVCTAEPLLTPLEELIRKNALIQETLIEKENLVFNMLSTPRGSLHDDVLPTVSSREITDHTDQTGLTNIIDKILISVLEVNKLQKAVNEALNVSEEDLNKQGEDIVIPNSIPANLVKTVANSLSLQLTSLLTDLKHLEEDRSKAIYCGEERMEVPEDVRTDEDTDD